MRDQRQGSKSREVISSWWKRLFFDRKVSPFDNWLLNVVTFQEMENNFKDIVWWAETQTKMPGKEELDGWEFGREHRHA